MSSSVFAVNITGTDIWAAACCDDRRAGNFEHGGGTHTLVEEGTKQQVEDAVDAHRKLLVTIPLYDLKPKPTECESCGQSKTAIRELQDLVRQMERRLAEAGEQQ